VYSNGLAANPVPVTVSVAVPLVKVGVEMLVIESGAVIPLRLKLAVPSTCPVSENGYVLVVPPAAKSCDHPTKLSPLVVVDAVKSTVPMLKNESILPYVSLSDWGVPVGEDVTVSSLPSTVAGQVVAVPIAGATRERKLGVKFAVEVLMPEAGTVTLRESPLAVPAPVQSLNV
jgi:hypothetical protein